MGEYAPKTDQQDLARYRRLIKKGFKRTEKETRELNDISLDLFGKVAILNENAKVSRKLPNGYEEV